MFHYNDGCYNAARFERYQKSMVLTIFLRLCVLRANPQDLPASHRLLAVALTAHALADVAGLADMLSPAQAFEAAALDTAALAALTAAVLWLRSVSARFTQTLT